MNLLNAKILANMKIKENNPNYPLYVTALTVLLDYYKDYKDLIVDIFTGTNIHIEDNSIANILTNYKLDDVDEDDINDTKCGKSSSGIAITIEDDHFTTITDTPYIVVNSSCGNTETLVVFIHEFNHVIKSYLNAFYNIDDNKVFVRSGLSYTLGCINEEFIERENYSEMFDEAINTLETTDITKKVLMLKEIIEDKRIKDYIDSLDQEVLQTEYGYESIVYLLKPLWENETFKSLIKNNIITGKIDVIQNEFNKYFDDDEYINLSNYIDELYELELIDNNNSKIKELKSKIRNIINIYNKKTIKIYEK